MGAVKRRISKQMARMSSTNQSRQFPQATLVVPSTKRNGPALGNYKKQLVLWTVARILAPILLGPPGMVAAQFIRDVGGVAVTVHSKTGFNEVLSGNSLGENKMRLTIYDAWVPLPRLKLGKGMMFGTLNGRMLDFQYDEETTLTTHQLKKIYEIKSTLIAVVPISKRLAVLGIAIPTVASDFKKSLSGHDVILDGIVALTRRFGRNHNLEIGIGAHALHAFGKTSLTPAVSLDYKSNDGKLIAQFYWPRLNVFYNLTERTQVGLAGAIDWTMHNLMGYQNARGEQIDHAQFTSIHAGLQLNHTLFGQFVFQAQGGVSAQNSYNLYDAESTEITHFSVGNMLYSKLMLTYRF